MSQRIIFYIFIVLFVSIFPLNAKVFKALNGDIYLTNIPMVAQNGDGFCAPATLSRILSYSLNKSITQYDIARLSSTNKDKGTDVQSMLDKLSLNISQLSPSTKIKFVSIIDFDTERYRRIISKYNKIAIRNKENILLYNSNTDLDLVSIFSKANKETLRKTSTHFEKRKFFNNIKKCIDTDKPLIWGVILGLVNEDKLQSNKIDGHLRIINGYNESSNEIIYTDPWGEGHEKKRMSLDDAYMITMSLHYAEIY